MLLSEWIADHARGQLDREAGQAIDTVAQAVMLLDKGGTVTVALRLEKTGGRLLVAGKVAAKAPEADPEAGLYYLGDHGLSKDDPHQLRFDDMRELNPDTGRLEEKGDGK
mgnify:CR=1 FL=1